MTWLTPALDPSTHVLAVTAFFTSLAALAGVVALTAYHRWDARASFERGEDIARSELRRRPCPNRANPCVNPYAHRLGECYDVKPIDDRCAESCVPSLHHRSDEVAGPIVVKDTDAYESDGMRFKRVRR